MPPSNRRTRARREPDFAQDSDADGPEPIRTPSRKRRKVNDTSAARSGPRNATRRRRHSSVGTDATLEEDDLPEEYDPVTASQMQVEETIKHLQVAAYKANVVSDWPKEPQDGKEAYAQLAGREWAFFATRPHINIGRPTKPGRLNSHQRDDSAASADMSEHLYQDPASEQSKMDIDLGPDPLVSRLHAKIGFGPEGWMLLVCGRNGAKVDGTNVPKNQKVKLHSGSVISIVGTEMIFVLPNEPAIIHPDILARSSGVEHEDTPEEEEETSFQTDPDIQNKAEGLPSFRSSTNINGAPRSQGLSQSQPKASQGSSRAVPGTPATDKKSPAYARGLMMESTQDIDYSKDGAKDIKPPHSYAYLIGTAILESPEQNLTLAQIYDHIKNNYAFYRHSGAGWQNSIRHNLSLNKAFEKIPRRTDEPGKGMKWKIVDSERDEFITKTVQNARRGIHRHGSSGPPSPAFPQPSPIQASRRLNTALDGSNSFQRPRDTDVKTSPRSTSPPLASYPTAQVSFTPDRGPRPPNLQTSNLPKENGGTQTPTYSNPNSGGVPDLMLNSGQSSAVRPGPQKSGLSAHAQQSPPTLSSSMHETGHPLVTPLVQRHAPRLAPPSTVHVPSHYMPNLSSPPPFWKYYDLGSTPAKGAIEFSPTKGWMPKAEPMEEKNESKEEEDEDDGAPAVQPSSPPQLMDSKDEEMSPTRTVSRPSSRRDVPPPKLELGKKPILEPGIGVGLGVHGVSGMNTNSAGIIHPPRDPQPIGNRFGRPQPNHFGTRHASNTPAPRAEEDEDGGIDLAKGFQKIGAFHRTYQQANGVAGV